MFHHTHTHTQFGPPFIIFVPCDFLFIYYIFIYLSIYVLVVVVVVVIVAVVVVVVVVVVVIVVVVYIYIVAVVVIVLFSFRMKFCAAFLLVILILGALYYDAEGYSSRRIRSNQCVRDCRPALLDCYEAHDCYPSFYPIKRCESACSPQFKKCLKNCKY